MIGAFFEGVWLAIRLIAAVVCVVLFGGLCGTITQSLTGSESAGIVAFFVSALLGAFGVINVACNWEAIQFRRSERRIERILETNRRKREKE